MTTPLNTDLLSRYQQFVADGYINPSATDVDKFVDVALGLVGEAGEVADLVKKKLRDVQKAKAHPEVMDLDAIINRVTQTERFTEEIGDVLWYLTHLCSLLGIKLEDVFKMNYTKLHKRYNNIYGDKDYGIT